VPSSSSQLGLREGSYGLQASCYNKAKAQATRYPAAAKPGAGGGGVAGRCLLDCLLRGHAPECLVASPHLLRLAHTGGLFSGELTGFLLAAIQCLALYCHGSI
jgi:hypothetical protein